MTKSHVVEYLGTQTLNRPELQALSDERIEDAKAFLAARWSGAYYVVGYALVNHHAYELSDRLPWDHINVKKGRAYLEKEQTRSVVQLAAMAEAK